MFDLKNSSCQSMNSLILICAKCHSITRTSLHYAHLPNNMFVPTLPKQPCNCIFRHRFDTIWAAVAHLMDQLYRLVFTPYANLTPFLSCTAFDRHWPLQTRNRPKPYKRCYHFGDAQTSLANTIWLVETY